MWVCLCKGVTDRQIRAVISAGARDVCEIGMRCRAGTGCGGCVPEVYRLLADHLAAEAYYAAHEGDPAELEFEYEHEYAEVDVRVRVLSSP